MANDVTKNPLVLDTAADDILTGDVWITAILWDAPTTAGHTCQIEDGDERIVWKRTVSQIGTANNVLVPPQPMDTFPGGHKIKGLSLGVIGSGVVYIYYSRTGGIK